VLKDLSIVIDLWCCPGVEQSLDRPLSAGWDWRPLGAQIGRVTDAHFLSRTAERLLVVSENPIQPIIRDLVSLSPLHPTLGATERRNLGTDVLAPISFLPWWDDAAQCQAFDLIRGLIEILVPFRTASGVTYRFLTTLRKAHVQHRRTNLEFDGT
jgi:hypothetical protein